MATKITKNTLRGYQVFAPHANTVRGFDPTGEMFSPDADGLAAARHHAASCRYGQGRVRAAFGFMNDLSYATPETGE